MVIIKIERRKNMDESFEGEDLDNIVILNDEI